MIPTLPAMFFDRPRPAHGRGALRAGPHSSSFLLPVDLKVDYDRDGEDDILGDSGDRATEDKPYRFWINNDDDDGDDYTATDTDHWLKDSTGPPIDSLRDLEDFTRLHVDLSSLKELIEDGELEVGLKMKGNATIRVFYSSGQDSGSEDYLFDQEEAQAQKAVDYRMIVNSSEKWFPSDVTDHLNADGHLHLIFEGIEAGKGEIVLITKAAGGFAVEGLARMSLG